MAKNNHRTVSRRKRKFEKPDGSEGIKHSDFRVETHDSDSDDDDDDNDGRDRTVAAKSDDDYQRPAKLDLIGKKEVVVFCFRQFSVVYSVCAYLLFVYISFLLARIVDSTV